VGLAKRKRQKYFLFRCNKKKKKKNAKRAKKNKELYILMEDASGSKLNGDNKRHIFAS
jgi:hypothetical protein